MAPLELQGELLGKRQQHYNKILEDAIKNKVTLDDLKVQETSSDLDAMLKIDLANQYRDIDYILSAFKSEDMLQVSRAIKKSIWLINDDQYKNLININYLKNQLFPQMCSKAICKLLLSIRIHLRNEDRVDEFFKHYEIEDVSTALRWLPNCSVKVIDHAVAKYHNTISLHLFKRLCEKTSSALDVFFNTPINNYTKGEYIKVAMFLINTEPEKFVNIAAKLSAYHAPVYNAKHTEVLMKHCKNHVFDKFDYYSKLIHLPTFGKFLGKDQIKNFLTQHAGNEANRDWFNYNNLKPLIDIMPTDGKFEFLKSVFIDKDKHNKAIPPPTSWAMSSCYEDACNMRPRNQIKKKKFIRPSKSHKNVYELYRHAPFNTAFSELKNLIRIEASADERSAMLAVLVGCTRGNAQCITALLQHYHDQHINEPFKNKMQFVSKIISKTSVHKYDERQWKLLEVLFQSMDVYAESEVNVQKCVEADIIYRTIREEPIPEIILKKFCWNTMKSFYSKLTNSEKDMIFKFLYDMKENKIDSQKIIADETIGLLDDLMMLLIDWNKDVAEYPFIINKLKELLQSKREPCWGYYVGEVFNTKKKIWRRHLFEESLIVNPSETAVINALKHDPNLLTRYEDKVELLRSNDHIYPKRLLRTLRIYWPALAYEWTAAYRLQLQKPSGHKAAARALCTLLPPNELLPFIKTFVPENSKIDWSAGDNSQISIQKIIAKSLHIARPQPSPSVVLLFLKGDYVQFALPSLSAVFYNLNSLKARKYIEELLDAPVSIQKHGIRYAAVRFNQRELTETLDKIWKCTNNSSIRAVIFEIAFQQLCKQKNADNVLVYWELLAKFIDSLSDKDNKIIYSLLTEVQKVPEVIQGKYCERSYKFLKTLPAKAGFEGSIKMLAGHIATVVETVDPDFVREVIMEHVDISFRRDMKRLVEYLFMSDVIVAHLLCVDSINTQMKTYEEILVPIMELVFTYWNVELEGVKVYREYFVNLLTSLRESLQKFIVKPKVIIPLPMFTAIYETLKTHPDCIHYVTLESWALTIIFLECAEKVKPTLANKNAEDEKLLEKSNHKEWDLLCLRAIPEFSIMCINRLIEQVSTRFPTITFIFAKALQQVVAQISVAGEFSNFKMKFYKSVLEKSDDVSVYLMVLSLCPEQCYQGDPTDKLEELKNVIYDHQSEEVKLHYFSKYTDKPQLKKDK